MALACSWLPSPKPAGLGEPHRDRTRGGGAEAAQRLVAGDPAGGQLDDGLEDRRQGVAAGQHVLDVTARAGLAGSGLGRQVTQDGVGESAGNSREAGSFTTHLPALDRVGRGRYSFWSSHGISWRHGRVRTGRGRGRAGRRGPLCRRPGDDLADRVDGCPERRRRAAPAGRDGRAGGTGPGRVVLGFLRHADSDPCVGGGRGTPGCGHRQGQRAGGRTRAVAGGRRRRWAQGRVVEQRLHGGPALGAAVGEGRPDGRRDQDHARRRRPDRAGVVLDLGHPQVVRLERGSPHRPAHPRVRSVVQRDGCRRARDPAPVLPRRPRAVRHPGLGDRSRARPARHRAAAGRRGAGAAAGAGLPERGDDADPGRQPDGAAAARVGRPRHRARPDPRLGGGFRRYELARPRRRWAR